MDLIRTPKIDNVRLVDRFDQKNQSSGTLYVTTTHLIFVDGSAKKETWLLHTHILSVEKLPISTSGSPIFIRSKIFLSVKFVIPRERDCQDVYTSLISLSQTNHIEQLYAFSYTSPDIEDKSFGWDFYDPQSEYLRMGVPNENWVQTNVNKDYELCDTYPRYLYIPKTASTQIIVGSANFRSRGRFPVLSYLHHENLASITRCSQPLAGFSARCLEDEEMLYSILSANPNSKYMYVVDTRPKINAMVNRAAGKGYENENFYSNIKFKFFGIDNIHVMRSSLQKLMDTCQQTEPNSSSFVSGLESCGWMRHIKSILDTSAYIASSIRDGISVLVHCSDGWDRTAQVCSLSSILLDPYYRTINGFQSLISKEWLSFGHKFTERCGFLENGDSKESSPVFTQFLDCTWQLMQQFPQNFEFNEFYLLTLHEHIYSCQFGTFIGNCEKDRLDLRIMSRTYSIWGYLKKYENDFLNPFYDRHLNVTQSNFTPSLCAINLRFWRGLYNRFDSGIHPRENLTEIISSTIAHTKSMENHIELLENKIDMLSSLLNKKITDSNGSAFESADLKILLQNKAKKYPETGSAVAKNTELSVEKIITEMQSVAVQWKSLRDVKYCNCATPFEHFTKKYHCWKCGNVYCLRCIHRMIPLPGHSSKQPVPVCKACYKDLRHSPASSFYDLQSLSLSN